MEKQKVIGYVRVSTEQQADEGVSLEAQQLKIQTYCDIYDLDLVRIEIDAGKSAKDMLKRPGIQAALAAVSSGEVTALVVTKIDRLSRSLMDMGKLVETHFKNGDGLISISEQINTGTATGRMFLNMIIMFSEYEREIIAERTTEALGHLKDQGVTLGAPKLGWAHSAVEGDVDEGGRRRIYKVEEEMETVCRIQELKKQELSLRMMCLVLTEEGHKTKRGGKWHPQTVRNILDRCSN
jgi:DNA invertase Pin-like site-specific DNA recombinase